MTIGFVLNDGSYSAPPIDPNEELDYKLDCTDILAGDTINAVSWAATKAKDDSPTTDIEIDVGRCNFTSTMAIVWLKNAILGSDSRITAHITTVAGRIYDRSFTIACKTL